MPLLKITNGTVYDPANNIDGVVMDHWVRDGKIVNIPVADALRSPNCIPNEGKLWEEYHG